MDDLAVATVSSAETSSNLTLDFDSPIALFDIAAFSENLSGASEKPMMPSAARDNIFLIGYFVFPAALSSRMYGTPI